GGFMGSGNHGKTKGDVQYAHAVPPSWNGATIVVLEQRAYFSAWRIVFEVPSRMSAMRVLPWGPGGLFCPQIRALLGEQKATHENPSIITTPSGSTLGSEGQRKTFTGWL